MKYWLIKSEPDVYPLEQLKADKRTCWDGIRNYQVRNMMRDEMSKGDLCIFYHSNAKPPGAAGVCEIVKTSYPDHTQFDPKNAHYDPKSDPDDPRWLMFDVKYKKTFKNFLPLAEIREAKGLEDLPLIRRGNRLSIHEMSAKEFKVFEKLGG